MKRLILLAMVVAMVFGTANVCPAGVIVLSGDTNIANGLNGSAGVGLSLGNRQLFTNILQGGDRVVFNDSFFANSAQTAMLNHYNSLPGVTATTNVGQINNAGLSDADLYISHLPGRDFVATELTALGDFLGRGGTIFLLGDHGFFTANNNRINTVLDSLGSSMRLVNNSFDQPAQTASGSQIAIHPLTTNVDALGGVRYARASEITVGNGTSLVFGSNMRTFVGVEVINAVPEPTSAAIWFVVGVCGFIRHRKAG